MHRESEYRDAHSQRHDDADTGRDEPSDNPVHNLHIPEQGRPLLKSNRLFVNLFRSIVGHSFVESHTFAMGITGKGYGRKNN